MKTRDIIKPLQAFLPFYTDKFSDKVSIKDISFDGNNASLTLDPSQTFSASLRAGNIVFVKGIRLKNPIVNIVSVLHNNGLATVTIPTQEDHYLVDSNYSQRGEQLYTVEVKGITPDVYNGVFDIVHGVNIVPDRFTFTYTVETTENIESFENSYIIEPAETANYFLGYQAVQSNINGELIYTLNIAQEQTPAYIPFVDENSYILFNIRITGSLSLDLFEAQYSKLYKDQYVLCVVTDDVTPSKSFRIQNDSLANNGGGADPRQRLIQNVVLYVFCPFPQNTSAYAVSGRSLKDEMEDLFPGILKSLYNIVVSSTLSEIPWSSLTFGGHGFVAYNEAYYIHQFSFQTTVDTIWTDAHDTSYPTRAFRDLYASYMSLNQNSDDILATFHLNLDEDSP